MKTVFPVGICEMMIVL